MDVDQPGQGRVVPQVDHPGARGDGRRAGADSGDAITVDDDDGVAQRAAATVHQHAEAEGGRARDWVLRVKARHERWDSQGYERGRRDAPSVNEHQALPPRFARAKVWNTPPAGSIARAPRR